MWYVMMIASLATAAAPAPGTTIAVLPMTATGIAHDTAIILDEILLTEVDGFHKYKVLGASDVSAMLGLERVKDAIGCDSAACASEIGGALGASVLLAARVGVLGEELVISAKLIDTKGATVQSRATATVPNVASAYANGVRRVVRELFGEQAPAPAPAATAATAAPVAPAAPPAPLAATAPSPALANGLETFLAVGLTAKDYTEFAGSGVPYWRWAADRNDESWLLEATKWAFTGMTVLLVGVGMAVDKDARGFMIGTGVFYGLAAGAVWTVDLMNIGNVPARITGVGQMEFARAR